MSAPSAIVVGGGLAGMVIARELALRRWRQSGSRTKINDTEQPKFLNCTEDSLIENIEAWNNPATSDGGSG
jgi:hypothetical protein